MMLKNLKRVPVKIVLKIHLEPFIEPLKVPPVGQPKNLFSFFLRVYTHSDAVCKCLCVCVCVGGGGGGGGWL